VKLYKGVGRKISREAIEKRLKNSKKLKNSTIKPLPAGDNGNDRKIA